MVEFLWYRNFVCSKVQLFLICKVKNSKILSTFLCIEKRIADTAILFNYG